MRFERSPGATLPELILALLILSVITAGGVLALRRGLEQYGVRAARDSMASAVAKARTLALAHGGARLVVDPAIAAVWIEAPVGSRVGDALRLGDVFGVSVAADQNTGGPIVVEFDALGFGRIASRTFRLRRGSAEARLTLSSYGRPRRW
ncbi:MAG: pilus assembly FimT family protein [Longimicrobiales bacterium]